MANRRFQTRSKRRTSWGGARVDMDTLVTGTPQFAVMQTEAQLEEFPTPTIVRTRGQLGVKADSGAAASPHLSSVGLGIYLADSAAVTAGSLQLPITDIGSDWLWWWNAVITENIGGAAENIANGGWMLFERVVVDSKAMRKVKNNQVLVLVAELFSEQGTGAANIFGTIRMLLKAP